MSRMVGALVKGSTPEFTAPRRPHLLFGGLRDQGSKGANHPAHHRAPVR
jgi:hypothetical protein